MEQVEMEQVNITANDNKIQHDLQECCECNELYNNPENECCDDCYEDILDGRGN